ncbi:DUF3885 domain-containing protein [Flavobacterium sp. RHBU_3]|uniref:DUF3885 domain-containing protein n=1 Tax=Flavobacterium sp. RHBU_3 TaxID=3391184 RepID=UPI0039852F5B
MQPNTKQELATFLATNFHKLRLHKPLFYNAEFGLRFDLQHGETFTDAYFKECIYRASTIYNTAFEPSDEVILVVSRCKLPRRKIKSTNYVFQQINGFEKSNLAYTTIRNVYFHGADRNLAAIKARARDLNAENIFTAIAHTDYPLKVPQLANNRYEDTEVYFINTSKHIILNMYDDCGLDIISPNKELLERIYNKHKNWILDYDKEKIAVQFAQ